MPKVIKNLKETILIEGKRQLLSNGYKNLNIRNITFNCGIGTGTFYNYFKNKDMLVTTIFESDWSLVLINTKSVIEENMPFNDKLRIIYEYMNKFLKNYIYVFAEMSLFNDFNDKKEELLKPIYLLIEKILIIHSLKGEVTSCIPYDKLSRFIVSNFVYICRTEDLSFDNLLQVLNL